MGKRFKVGDTVVVKSDHRTRAAEMDLQRATITFLDGPVAHVRLAGEDEDRTIARRRLMRMETAMNRRDWKDLVM